MSTRIITDMLRGVKTGLAFGVAYAIWAAVLFVARGETAFAKQNTTFAAVLGFYLLGGTAAGALVGTLLPLARRRVGAPLVGVVACFPLALGLRVAVRGMAPWGPEDSAFLVLFPLLFGAPGGMILRGIFVDG